VPVGILPPGGIDQNSAHRLGGRREEMPAVGKALGIVPDKPQKRLVYQRRGL